MLKMPVSFSYFYEQMTVKNTVSPKKSGIVDWDISVGLNVSVPCGFLFQPQQSFTNVLVPVAKAASLGYAHSCLNSGSVLIYPGP